MHEQGRRRAAGITRRFLVTPIVPLPHDLVKAT